MGGSPKRQIGAGRAGRAAVRGFAALFRPGTAVADPSEEVDQKTHVGDKQREELQPEEDVHGHHCAPRRSWRA